MFVDNKSNECGGEKDQVADASEAADAYFSRVGPNSQYSGGREQKPQ